LNEVRTLLHPVTGRERVVVIEAKDTSLSHTARGESLAGQARALPISADGTSMPLMMQMIRPSVRDRWMSTTVRNYTPEKVEQICRGAMAGELSSQWEMFDLMEQTWPRLSKNLNQLKDAVVAMEWNIQPWAPKNGKPSDEAQRRADLIENLLWDFEPEATRDENDFESTVRDLLDAKGKGIVALEVDWMAADSDYGAVIKPRCTRWVHPRHYGYPSVTGLEVGDELMLDARQIAVDNLGSGIEDRGLGTENLIAGGFLPFPKNKFIVGIWKQKSGHPISGAMLRILGFWWAGANFAAEWFLNYAQIFGMPIRWATYDPSLPQADKDVLEEMLATMGSAGYAMLPAGVNLELKEAAKGASENPHLGVLNFADTLCDILILRQTLTTDTGAKGSGSRALGQVHQGVLDQVIIAAGDWTAARLNAQLIRPMCQLNFGDTKECPWLMPALVEEEDEAAMADRDVKLAGIGVKFPVDYIHDRYKIPRPGPNDEVLEAPMLTATDNTSAENSNDVKAGHRARTDAHSHQHDEVTDKLLQSVTGVDAKWLGGIKPLFVELVTIAKGARDEAEFERALTEVIAKSSQRMPELFARLDTDYLAEQIEGTLGAACVNGAVSGYLKRRVNRGSRGSRGNEKAVAL
jgi:phage gp29-like protein